MTKTSVTFEGFPLEREDFQRLARKMDPVVYSLPREISEFLRLGLSPKGIPQPPNSPYTIWLKGHAVPGVDTGYLSSEFSWSVKASATSWEISPPFIRQPVIDRLSRVGFTFVDFPIGWEHKFAEEALRQLIDMADR